MTAVITSRTKALGLMTGGLFAVAAALAVIQPWQGDTSTVDRTTLAARIQGYTGVPLALPERLPEGVEWRLSEASTAAENGAATMRASVFAYQPIDAGPTITLCSEAGPSQCIDGDLRLDRTVDGVRVVIAFYGAVSNSQREFWATVPMALNRVPDWVPQ